jgi:hypothetical protein
MTLNQNINSNTLQQFQKLWDRISSLNKVISMVNKELELIKNSINEIDLSELEGSLKQYTDAAVESIPQPDLSDYLTTSNVLFVPSLPPIPGQDESPFKDGNLLVPKKYVDTTINNSKPNLTNYATKDEIPDLSNYLTINDVYIQPQTNPINLTVIKVINPENHKLITKKYLNSAMPNSSSLLTINDTGYWTLYNGM